MMVESDFAIDYCYKCGQDYEAVDIDKETFKLTLNLLSNTIFSIDLEDTASEFKFSVRGILVEAAKPNLVDYFPFLEKIDPQGIDQVH